LGKKIWNNVQCCWEEVREHHWELDENTLETGEEHQHLEKVPHPPPPRPPKRGKIES